MDKEFRKGKDLRYINRLNKFIKGRILTNTDKDRLSVAYAVIAKADEEGENEKDLEKYITYLNGLDSGNIEFVVSDEEVLEGALDYIKTSLQFQQPDQEQQSEQQLDQQPREQEDSELESEPKPEVVSMKIPAATTAGVVRSLGKGTVIKRDISGLVYDNYSLDKQVKNPVLLMIDISTCKGSIYPVVNYLAGDSKQINILEYISNAIVAVEKRYSCIKGENYIISEFVDHDRYIYVNIVPTKAG